MFVNGVVGSDASWVYEFDLALVPAADADADAAVANDDVFATTYRCGALPFKTGRQGGARAIGLQAGAAVWLSASPTGPPGGGTASALWAVDEESNLVAEGKFLDLYDPFVFIDVSPPAGEAGWSSRV